MTEPAGTDQTEILKNALQQLLSDVEAIACTERCYGMPVENSDHPFHESVKAARSALANS